MLLHLIPKMINKYADCDVSLIDVTIPELDLVLKGNDHVVIRKPYPNKTYCVAYRKTGRKAINGLFIKTDRPISQFSMITRWGSNTGCIATHQINYSVLDGDFDTVSHDHMNWGKKAGVFADSRYPEHLNGLTPMQIAPTMEILH